MSNEIIEQNTDALLRVVGADKEGVGLPVRQLLHHLLTARAMFDEMDELERKNIRKFNRKLRNVFDSNFVLKEGKRKKEKETSSPAPLLLENLLEKEIKEKDEKNTHTVAGAFVEKSDFFEARKEAFRKECLKYVGQVDTTVLANFFNYWSEACGKKGLMRWEWEKTWETKKRLARWVKNSYTISDATAAIKLERTKGKEAKQAKVSEQLQLAAQVRQQQEETERRKDEEAKARRMKPDEIDNYLRNNPNGFLARLQRAADRNQGNS